MHAIFHETARQAARQAGRQAGRQHIAYNAAVLGTGERPGGARTRHPRIDVRLHHELVAFVADAHVEVSERAGMSEGGHAHAPMSAQSLKSRAPFFAGLSGAVVDTFASSDLTELPLNEVCWCQLGIVVTWLLPLVKLL